MVEVLAGVLTGLLVLAGAGWYLSFTAGRLDRLHHRVETSRAALEARLARRAATAVETVGALDPASALLVLPPASAALGAVSGPDAEIDGALENEFSRSLHHAFGDPAEVAALRRDPVAADLLDELLTACERVQLARRFHNDAVAQAQRVRGKRVVRWARLAGRAPMPRTVEIDDTTPAGLVADRPDG